MKSTRLHTRTKNMSIDVPNRDFSEDAVPTKGTFAQKGIFRNRFSDVKHHVQFPSSKPARRESW